MASLFQNLPPRHPLNTHQAELLLEDVRADETLTPLISAHADFFAWLVEGSPFLARLMRRYPDVLLALQEAAPEDYLDTLYTALDSEMAAATDKDAAMALLRHVRNRAALAIALADLADAWDVETVTKYLTRLADLAMRCGLDFLLREAVDEKRLTVFSRDGLVVLALGHGFIYHSKEIDTK